MVWYTLCILSIHDNLSFNDVIGVRCDRWSASNRYLMQDGGDNYGSDGDIN
jgi:hypothetical protein